ncbi:hypothetical protein [Paenibacillus sp. HW567]|nr:hypothetical protein [Paenibacillus sp. HW567]
MSSNALVLWLTRLLTDASEASFIAKNLNDIMLHKTLGGTI